MRDRAPQLKHYKLAEHPRPHELWESGISGSLSNQYQCLVAGGHTGGPFEWKGPGMTTSQKQQNSNIPVVEQPTPVESSKWEIRLAFFFASRRPYQEDNPL